MKERKELIKTLEEYQQTFGMGYDSSCSIKRLIQDLKDEENQDNE